MMIALAGFLILALGVAGMFSGGTPKASNADTEKGMRPYQHGGDGL